MKETIVKREFLLPFSIITLLFVMWGFANDITNPMVAAFKTVMDTTNARASLVQFAFYGGYGTMAIPAAIFARKYSYKKGVLLGLLLYAFGALMFIPAAHYEVFGYFLVSLYVLTFGLAFLETTASPYILSMGDEATATRRLNLAQSFNPLGSLAGMFVASNFILSSLDSDVRDSAGNLVYDTLSSAEKAVVRTHDLGVISKPYIILGLVVLAMFFVILIMKMPDRQQKSEKLDIGGSFKRLLKNKKYREGVIAQIFYMAAQIMCWTFIIQYAENLGFDKTTAQHYNILAMVLFGAFRFISTFVMKYINPRQLMMIFAICAIGASCGVIFINGILGLYCLVALSAFMSLMFPTIYGIALHGLGEDATLGASGLVMALVGGALMPPLQGAIIDMGTIGWLPAVNVSFVLPLICYVVIAIYGYRAYKVFK